MTFDIWNPHTLARYSQFNNNDTIKILRRGVGVAYVRQDDKTDKNPVERTAPQYVMIITHIVSLFFARAAL